MYINISIINQSNPIAASHQNRNRTLRCCCFFLFLSFFFVLFPFFLLLLLSLPKCVAPIPDGIPASGWPCGGMGAEVKWRVTRPVVDADVATLTKKKYPPPLSLSLFFFLFHPPAEEMDVAAGRSEVELRPPSDSGTAGNLKKKRTRKKKKNRRTTPIEEKKTSFQLGSADSNGTEVQP